MKTLRAIVVLAALVACDAKPAPEPEVLQLAPTEETTAAIRRILDEPVTLERRLPCHEILRQARECESQ